MIKVIISGESLNTNGLLRLEQITNQMATNSGFEGYRQEGSKDYIR